MKKKSVFYTGMFKKILLSILLITSSFNIAYLKPIERAEFVLRNGGIFVRSADGLARVNMAQFLENLSDEDFRRLLLSRDGFVFRQNGRSYSINADLPNKAILTRRFIKKWLYRVLIEKAAEIALKSFFDSVSDMIASDVQAVREEGERLRDGIMENDYLRPVYLFTTNKAIPTGKKALKKAKKAYREASRIVYGTLSGSVRDGFVFSKAFFKLPKFINDSFKETEDDDEGHRSIKKFFKRYANIIKAVTKKVKKEVKRKERK